jgi:hypothetical protein
MQKKTGVVVMKILRKKSDDVVDDEHVIAINRKLMSDLY